MADICIVYAREDAREAASILVRLLGQRWSVWWDADIDEGDYRRVIKGELAVARCVVPIWSKAAEFSKTLHDELQYSEKRQVPILPIRVHDVDAPMGFGAYQATQAIGWPSTDSDIHEHIEKIARAIANPKGSKFRLEDLGAPNAPRLPAFFYSVSSHQTQLDPIAALEALHVFGASSILVSAYDMAKTRRTPTLERLLKRHRRNNGFILLDSGKYEKTRLEDKSWTIKAFHEALSSTPHDMAFCYDELDPPKNFTAMLKSVVRAVERDSKHTKATLLPIAHLPKQSDGTYLVDFAPKLIRKIAEELKPPLIAIPERELGDGIFARTKTMLAIRNALQGLSTYQPIHILGTGNPTSIGLLTAAGADSFDGLEWCRYAIDGKTRTLHHFQLYELFKWQDQYAASPVTTEAATNDKVRYTGKVVFHNLDFYNSWLEKLRAAARDEKRMIEFMTKLLPEEVMELARETLPSVL